MKRHFFALASWVAFLFFPAVIFSQAVLPTSWNFDTTAPTGWSESLGGSNTRYANGQAGQACRLDATGDYVMVQFSEEPGALSYYLKGQNSGGAWAGTFTVQESADGISFTSLHTFTDGMINPTSYTQYNDVPQSSSRYLRFYFTNKVSGHNVALDEITLAMPTAGPEQEINVMQNADNIPSGFTFSVGNAASTVFSIQNLGLVNTLTIGSILLSGSDAGDFSLSGVPTSVAANTSENFTLHFSSVGLGSRFCTITIANNDASEGIYTINIYAIAGTLATEPTAQAVNLTFPGLVSWDFNVAFSAGSPAAEKYLVLRKKGNDISDSPTDGTTFRKGDWIGASQVVYVGNAGSFNARNVEVATNYYFKIFSFNGPEGFENYLTSSPLSGMVTTPDSNPGTFYNGVNHNSADFVTKLNQALNPSNYTQVFYSNYISTLIDHFYVKDTVVQGQSLNLVTCLYSGVPYTYPAGFQWNGSGNATLSREHSYPQSWMPTYFATNFPDRPEVSDLHNIFPILQNECNSVRSNYPYGDVITPTTTFLNTALGNNADGQRVYKPRDSAKGDVARAVMYHALKNNKDGEDFSFPEQISLIIPYGQDEYVLKKWHFQDLPDRYEMARNEYIQSQQHNRNAFIDSVQFPCFIRFSNLTKWEPQFTVSNGILHAVDQGISYQWFLNGEEIQSATSTDYTIGENGNYALAIQPFSECPVIRSTPVYVSLAGVEDSKNRDFSVSFFPNPSSGQFNLHLLSHERGEIQLRIFDIHGKQVWNKQLNHESGETEHLLHLDLAAGIYTAEVIFNHSRRVERLMVR